MNFCDSESLPEEIPYQPKQQELQQAEAKLLYKEVKRETPTTEYYKAAEIEKRLNHNPGQAKHDSRRTSGQHNAEATPRHTPAEIKELTEHRSDHVRPESHNTSTNNPDLHEVREGQPGVTTRDTEQPCEKQCLTTGTATSDLHKVEGPQAEPPYTSDTPRGQGTTHFSATRDGTKERVIETVVGCLHKTPRENPQTETTKHSPQGQPTKPKEGIMGKALKACIPQRGLPIHTNKKGHKNPYWRMNNQTHEGPSRCHGRLLLALHDAPPLRTSHRRSTKPELLKEERGNFLGEEKEGEKPKEGEGMPAKAFSLRPPRHDGAGRRVTNCNMTAAQTATRTRPPWAPQQPDRGVLQNQDEKRKISSRIPREERYVHTNFQILHWYNLLIGYVGIHGQRRLTEALVKGSLLDILF
ncbi:hypothetical protein Taro_030066 [Colocasia esculenta]|uniref:Uncharacterized protein n=1 Tax=Colocasia esculenta TaxID=4460 RepID=A0A843VQV5_COLES|nr:hypothetical protein [Colocasia esculenta]